MKCGSSRALNVVFLTFNCSKLLPKLLTVVLQSPVSMATPEVTLQANGPLSGLLVDLFVQWREEEGTIIPNLSDLLPLRALVSPVSEYRKSLPFAIVGPVIRSFPTRLAGREAVDGVGLDHCCALDLIQTAEPLEESYENPYACRTPVLVLLVCNKHSCLHAPILILRFVSIGDLDAVVLTKPKQATSHDQ